MLLSTCAVSGLTYVLPRQLGVHVEYYFLELVSITLRITACVVFTSWIMDYFQKRDRKGARGEREAGPGGERNDPASQNDQDGHALLPVFAQVTNWIVLVLMMTGCELLVGVLALVLLTRSALHALHLHAGVRWKSPLTALLCPSPHTDPCVVLPIYRADGVSDLTRIFISCVAHPLLQEL